MKFKVRCIIALMVLSLTSCMLTQLPTNNGEQNNSSVNSQRSNVRASMTIEERIALDAEKEATMLNEFTSVSYTKDSPYIKQDPFGTSPLSAQVGFKTSVPVYITKIVIAADGKTTNTQNFKPSTPTTELYFPLHGLHPSTRNTITVSTSDVTIESTFPIDTVPSPDDLGEVTVITPADKNQLNRELYFTGIGNSHSAAIDLEGNIRWYTTDEFFTGNPTVFPPELPTVEKLNNGNFLTRTAGLKTMFEFDLRGRIYRAWHTAFRLHHDIEQLPNNDFLVSAEEANGTYVEDQVAIIDYETSAVNYVLDFNKERTGLLDPAARPVQPIILGNTNDWFHGNSVELIENNAGGDDLIIVSARHQNAVFGVNANYRTIRWILGTHDQWASEYRSKLLTPVDRNDNPITGVDLNKTFWNWAQHSAIVKSTEGNKIQLYVFDNGDYRSFDPNLWVCPKYNYSRAVLFEIDQFAMTVKILWEYGMELGQDYYSSYVGNVLPDSITGNLMINFGGTNSNIYTRENWGVDSDVPGNPASLPSCKYDYNNEGGNLQEVVKVVEIDPSNNRILYEFHHKGKQGVLMAPSYKVMKSNLYNNLVE